MYRVMKSGVLALLAACVVFSGSLAFAKEHGGSSLPSGFQQGEKKGWEGQTTPPGWTQGKKEGWKGAEMPPGFVKKQASKRWVTTKPATRGFGKGKAKGLHQPEKAKGTQR